MIGKGIFGISDIKGDSEGYVMKKMRIGAIALVMELWSIRQIDVL